MKRDTHDGSSYLKRAASGKLNRKPLIALAQQPARSTLGVSLKSPAIGLHVSPLLDRQSPDSRQTMMYDAVGNVLSITDPLGKTTQYTYDAAGNTLSETDPAGQVTNYQYDVMSRLISVTTPKSEKTQYAYLPTGELSQITDPLGNVTQFQYDQLGRTIQKIDPLGMTTTRTYDGDGNLVQEVDPNGNIKKYKYDVLNRLIEKDLPDNTVFLTYDTRGNLTSIKNNQSVVELGYDLAGRLTSSSSYGIGAYSSLPRQTLTFGLDANGNRTSLTDPTGTTIFTLDNNQLLARYTHSNLRTDDVLAVDVTSQGAAEKLAQNSGSYFYLKDAIGSVTDIADGNGNRIQHYVYSSYGDLLSIQDTMGNDITANPILATSYMFAGREYDSESGLSYNRARYYDPGTGRFLQKDPSPGELTVPASEVNSYVYTRNDPTNLVDPNGQIAFLIALGIGALVSGLISGIAHGIITHDWSLGGFATAFGLGALSAVAIGLAGFAGGYFSAQLLGAGEVVSQMVGAVFGAGTGAGLGAATNPGHAGLGALFGAIGGFFGGLFAGASGFNAAQAGLSFFKGLVTDIAPQVEADPKKFAPEAPPIGTPGNPDKIPIEVLCSPGWFFDTTMGRCRPG